MSLENIPVDTTKKFLKLISLIEPYNYEKIKPANTKIITSLSIVPNCMTHDEILKESILESKKCFIEEMKKSIKDYKDIKYSKNSINIYNSKMRCVLLPIYLLNIKDKDKIYSIIINGETGKINGDIPLSTSKIIFIWILLFILIFVILILIYLGGIK